jgi:hypothetical protein
VVSVVLQLCTELAEAINHAQVARLILSGHVQGLKLGAESLILLTELRYTLSQLLQSDQLFLISGHQSVDLVLQARLFSAEILCALAQGSAFLASCIRRSISL